MAQWAPYVCVRVIGSVAPASRKQLIPTSGKRQAGFVPFHTQQQLRRPFRRFRRVVIVSVSVPSSWVKYQQEDVPPFLLCQMPSRAPLLGSLAVQSPSSQSSQLVHVSPATCHNLSLFKGSVTCLRILSGTSFFLFSRYARSIRDVIWFSSKYVNPSPGHHTSVHPSIHPFIRAPQGVPQVG